MSSVAVTRRLIILLILKHLTLSQSKSTLSSTTDTSRLSMTALGFCGASPCLWSTSSALSFSGCDVGWRSQTQHALWNHGTLPLPTSPPHKLQQQQQQNQQQQKQRPRHGPKTGDQHAHTHTHTHTHTCWILVTSSRPKVPSPKRLAPKRGERLRASVRPYPTRLCPILGVPYLRVPWGYPGGGPGGILRYLGVPWGTLDH